MSQINETHDPSAESWVDSANDPATDFPLQNLPHGVFVGPDGAARGGVAIGDQVLDVAAVLAAGLFSAEAEPAARAAAEPQLNGLMEMGSGATARLRQELFAILRSSSPARQNLLVPQAGVQMQLPAQIGSFSDFFSSIFHAASARPGRGEQPLPDCFAYLPIAYHGRASSVTPSGATLPRPHVQARDPATGAVSFEPTRALDFELEVGAFYGESGNPLGQPIPIGEARGHLFGYVLLNDWSVRDTQAWESRLGPFLAKSAMTTISPWVVTAEALIPFRCAAFPRRPSDPPLLAHLDDPEDRASGSLGIGLRALLSTAEMRRRGDPPAVICETGYASSIYWTFSQMLAHHTSNGCNLVAGDLLGSGTCSGEALSSAATLWEITGGVQPLSLPTGETRLWLEDGDELTLTGCAERAGYRAVGFGPCRGVIAPAMTWPKALPSGRSQES